uniref:Uncharacterized protein n=1 Tax=Rousettus aegyptiacus TaxID=9407 RepID=A0A7J8JI81_ROUAE|nr:hypothetical protein HJG63_010298 [Rousettus aegyptiacus]
MYFSLWSKPLFTHISSALTSNLFFLFNSKRSYTNPTEHKFDPFNLPEPYPPWTSFYFSNADSMSHLQVFVEFIFYFIFIYSSSTGSLSYHAIKKRYPIFEFSCDLSSLLKKSPVLICLSILPPCSGAHFLTPSKVHSSQ